MFLAGWMRSGARSRGSWMCLAAAWLALSAWMGPALAQTAIITGLTDQACVGTRAGSTRSCTANDLAASISFTQPSATAISSCVAGQVLTLDAVATLQSGSPDRYNIGLFTGQTGNDPRTDNAAALCSLGVFPTTPAPFSNLGGVNSTACGDFAGSSTATLQISGIKATCLPAAGNNQLGIPYVLAWDNQASGACTVPDLTASTNSKCNVGLAAYVVGVYVQGWIKIIKQTNPSTATQTFSFSTSTSPSAVVSPTTSWSIGNGQAQTVTFPLHPTGGTQYITLTEVLSSGWEQTATISCTTPSGGSATYVSVNNANRTIAAAMDATNFGAICTITNNKQTRVRARKAVPNSDTGTFNLTAQTNAGSFVASNQGDGGMTAYQQSYSGSVTLTETSGSNASITKYVSGVSCVNDETGAVITPSATTLTGATRTVVYTPPANADSSCLFTNTRTAALTLTKTNSLDSVTAGATTSYAITLANNGPSDADGATFRDPAATGLACTSVSCTGVSGAASCPAGGSVTVAALQGGGITLPSFPAASSITFAVTCNVTASGV